MTSVAKNHLWQAEDYHQHSSVQQDAATQLLQEIQLKGHEHILDVGCGDGKITVETAKRVPKGIVIGMDASPEMIKFASKSFPKDLHPNLTFLVQDAHHFNYNSTLDIIFTSFALQWLPDPSLFFKSAYISLKSTGCIVATIPLGVSSELEKAIKATTSLPKWSAYFQSYSPGWHFISNDEYKQLLVENDFTPTHFAVVLQKTFFPSREAFENYIVQWLSYLHPLPQDLKPLFLKQVIDEYLRINPPLENSTVSFKFSRLDLIAIKSNL